MHQRIPNALYQQVMLLLICCCWAFQGKAQEQRKAVSDSIQLLELSDAFFDQEALPTKANSYQLYHDWRRTGDYNKALTFLHHYWKSIQMVDSLQRDRLEVAIKMAWDFGNVLDNTDTAILFLNHALEELKTLNDSTLLGQTYTYMGFMEQKESHYQVGLDWYLKSVQVKEAVGHKGHLAFSYNLIGQIYKYQGLYEKSLVYHQMAQQNWFENSPKPKVLNMLNMAELYTEMGKPEEGLKRLRETLQASLNQKGHPHLVVIHSAFGKAYLRIGNTDSALVHYQQVLKLVSPKRWKRVCRGNMGLAKVYAAMGQHEQALPYALKVLETAKKYELIKLENGIHGTLQTIYGGLKRYKLAWYHLQQHALLSDSIKSVESQTKVVEIERLFDQEKNEHQIALLELNKVANQEKLAQEKQLRQSMLFFLAFLLMVTGIIAWLWYKVRGSNAMLQAALEQRNILYREMHHRIKNNLQLISTLLFLQSKNLSKKSKKGPKAMLIAQDAIGQMKGRVRSMALVHQKLSFHEAGSWINAGAYLRELVQELLSSLGPDDSLEFLTVDVEDLILDLDTVLSVGLVVNETITNTLKHAFTIDQQGSMNVLFRKEGAQIVLRIADNGKGLSKEELSVNNDSFGLGLIRSLAEKLEASMELMVENGTVLEIRINRFQELEKGLPEGGE